MDKKTAERLRNLLVFDAPLTEDEMTKGKPLPSWAVAVTVLLIIGLTVLVVLR